MTKLKMENKMKFITYNEGRMEAKQQQQHEYYSKSEIITYFDYWGAEKDFNRMEMVEAKMAWKQNIKKVWLKY